MKALGIVLGVSVLLLWAYCFIQRIGQDFEDDL